MSTIFGTPTVPRSTIGCSCVISLAATLKRWWIAYITWRIEQAAIAALSSMSDRELQDMGLTRSEIVFAAKGGTPRGRVLSRCS
jgi:uncharacterized protein YjiS (DUF1127 family)